MILLIKSCLHYVVLISKVLERVRESYSVQNGFFKMTIKIQYYFLIKKNRALCRKKCRIRDLLNSSKARKLFLLRLNATSTFTLALNGNGLFLALRLLLNSCVVNYEHYLK